MLWGKKRQQIERLTNRVKQLEDIVCPNMQHEWICVGRDHELFGSSVETVYKYQCKRCKKVELAFDEPWIVERRANDATD